LKTLRFISLLLALLLQFALALAAEWTLEIEVNLKDSETKKALKAANIEIWDAGSNSRLFAFVTDNNGKQTIKFDTPKEYVLLLGKTGYATKSILINTEDTRSNTKSKFYSLKISVQLVPSPGDDISKRPDKYFKFIHFDPARDEFIWANQPAEKKKPAPEPAKPEPVKETPKETPVEVKADAPEKKEKPIQPEPVKAAIAPKEPLPETPRKEPEKAVVRVKEEDNNALNEPAKPASKDALGDDNHSLICPYCFRIIEESQIIHSHELEAATVERLSNSGEFSPEYFKGDDKRFEPGVYINKLKQLINIYRLDTIAGFKESGFDAKINQFNQQAGGSGQLKDTIELLRTATVLNSEFVAILNEALSRVETDALYSLTALKYKSLILEKELENQYVKAQIKHLEEELRGRDVLLTALRQKYLWTIAAGSIFLGLSFLLFLLWRRVRQVNEKLAISNEEINKSLHYAQRIQSAILPSAQTISQIFKENFVLFLPKDIVSGDFYWTHKRLLDRPVMGFNPDGQTTISYFAVCDCTGHGVPGALVSQVCTNALIYTVNDLGEREPGRIFDTVKTLIAENFSQSAETLQDGMDASIVAVIQRGGESKIFWCGANNPLWIYRKKTRKIEEIKPDKQPIGRSENTREFTTQAIQADKNDVLYLFTDGFADQFGGEKNKKLTKAKFREFLESIGDIPMETQKIGLKEFHKQYKGEQEQIDDICVTGLLIS
jgi:serine phosphatase RsbU (regulator of sigma subunit)